MVEKHKDWFYPSILFTALLLYSFEICQLLNACTSVLKQSISTQYANVQLFMTKEGGRGEIERENNSNCNLQD